MYRRFLNDNDYLGVISKDSLNQLTRGNIERYIQAEEAAEMSVIEYLSENYEIERELNKGKYIAEYDRRITYPVGVHIYFEGKIYKTIRSLSGFKAPSDRIFWEENTDHHLNTASIKSYSQFSTYYTQDVVKYNNIIYTCQDENGFNFQDIRIPMVYGWTCVEATEWLPVAYELWSVVEFDDSFYTLVSLEGFDNNINPYDSDNWGAIADYCPNHNEYELSSCEFVVYNNKVFHPEIDVNADIPEPGTNLSLHDPRNYNLKKHMVRLAVYELTKLVAPNNVGLVRVRDYEDSMKWLADSGKLRINPQIPRKIACDNRPVTDWQLATFQTNYDPYKNPWLT